MEKEITIKEFKDARELCILEIKKAVTPILQKFVDKTGVMPKECNIDIGFEKIYTENRELRDIAKIDLIDLKMNWYFN